jgi:rhamnogalacturonan endolyase
LKIFNFQFSIFNGVGGRLLLALFPLLGVTHAFCASPVSVSETRDTFALSNDVIKAEVEKRTGTLLSLKYEGHELIAQTGSGANGGYWSSVGRGRPGSHHIAQIRIDPATNGGERAEICCQLRNDPSDPASPVDVDYRYALGRGEHWLYVSAVLEHKPGYPAFGVGEARYCLKLNPAVFDYMTVDSNRSRVMPSPYDWDHGDPLNLKEARRMTTGVHKGEAEHKYDYSAVFSETPAYGWSSTKHNIGLWIINPSLEYLGGGPTKAELTGHLDVNPGGLPTLLNMWVGSHYGGTTIGVATNEAWTKFVGPFLLYCNSNRSSRPEAGSAVRNTDESGRGQPHSKILARSPEALETPPGLGVRLPSAALGSTQEPQLALWHDALDHAAAQSKLWPYAWVSDTNYPLASARSTVTGRIVLKDPYDPAQKLTNLWVGLTAPDYDPPPRSGFGFGFRRGTNSFSGTNSAFGTNFGARGFGRFGTNSTGRGFGGFRGGFPQQVDWQRDAKFYQFWTRADAQGAFSIPNIRPGSYTLHAFADGVIGEFTLTNLIVSSSEKKSLGELTWSPKRFGQTVFQIGIPDRTAREFRHGDRFWQWGLYFDYPKEFPDDVNFIVGQSDWHKDWNYVQPPRIESRNVAVVGEEDESGNASASTGNVRDKNIRSSTWRITFTLPDSPQGKATLRLPFCGTHMGCNVEAFANDKPVGETGVLPSTSAMQRDGISGYWTEKDLTFDAKLLTPGTNVIKLLSHANSWSQGVMYDCVRLELDSR